MKKVMFTAFAVGLCMTANLFVSNKVMAQNNCNIINSVTLNAPNNLNLGAVTYAESANEWNDWIDCQLPLNSWIYVAYSKDNANNSKLYFNGELVKSSTYQNLPYSWNSLRLGTDAPNLPNSFLMVKSMS